MNANLENLIEAYQSAVREAMHLMHASGIEAPESNTAWACNGVPQASELLGGVRYFKHGYGCAVHLPSGVVDFDFGEHGEINGFDLWRLQAFARNRLNEYGFASPAELERAFKVAVDDGELVYSGYILYYLRRVAA